MNCTLGALAKDEARTYTSQTEVPYVAALGKHQYHVAAHANAFYLRRVRYCNIEPAPQMREPSPSIWPNDTICIIPCICSPLRYMSAHPLHIALSNTNIGCPMVSHEDVSVVRSKDSFDKCCILIDNTNGKMI